MQLTLPLAELTYAADGAFPPPPTRRIYCNRNLRLDQIDWVGFDMDYTLAIYHQAEMDRLSIEATAAKLVERDYPEELLTMRYRTDFPIRGLLIDKKLGNVLKMDRYKYVKRAYHGMRELSRDERRQLYHTRRLRPGTRRYHWVDTLYALSEVAVYAAAVDAMEHRGVRVDYAQLFDDVRACIDLAHADGTILDEVMGDLPRYIFRDPQLGATLHKLRSSGKRLFLLTNSRAAYTDRMMRYLFDDAMPEYPSWKNYFDIIVTASRKPFFFKDHAPFLEVRGDGEPRPIANGTLERGHVYAGGNLAELDRILGVTPDRVLYIGDHIYGDVLRAKKETVWRTVMIIQEMDEELLALERCADSLVEMDVLETTRDRLYDELRERQERLKRVQRELDHWAQEGEPVPVERGADGAPEKPGVEPLQAAGADARTGAASHDGHDVAPASGATGSGTAVPLADPGGLAARRAALDSARVRYRRAIDRLRARLRAVDAQYSRLEEEVDAAFHPFWGSLFKSGPEVSSFGDQVEEYACLYTTRVSNFLPYSPMHYFRSARDRMPHELGH